MHFSQKKFNRKYFRENCLDFELELSRLAGPGLGLVCLVSTRKGMTRKIISSDIFFSFGASVSEKGRNNKNAVGAKVRAIGLNMIQDLSPV